MGSRRKERIYLSGYEIYREYGSDGNAVNLERQTLHVMDDKHRIALVETRTQGDDGSSEQLVRYQFSNQLDSATLELDDQSQIITYEEYYPYGSTSYQAVSSQTETPKRYRFTGKERDEENELSYHSARYYAPWLGRWTACDPAGAVDSYNLYSYVRNNPLTLHDPSGQQGSNPSHRLQKTPSVSQKIASVEKKWHSILNKLEYEPTSGPAPASGSVPNSAYDLFPAEQVDRTLEVFKNSGLIPFLKKHKIETLSLLYNQRPDPKHKQSNAATGYSKFGKPSFYNGKKIPPGRGITRLNVKDAQKESQAPPFFMNIPSISALIGQNTINENVPGMFNVTSNSMFNVTTVLLLHEVAHMMYGALHDEAWWVHSKESKFHKKLREELLKDIKNRFGRMSNSEKMRFSGYVAVSKTNGIDEYFAELNAAFLADRDRLKRVDEEGYSLIVRAHAVLGMNIVYRNKNGQVKGILNCTPSR